MDNFSIFSPAGVSDPQTQFFRVGDPEALNYSTYDGGHGDGPTDPEMGFYALRPKRTAVSGLKGSWLPVLPAQSDKRHPGWADIGFFEPSASPRHFVASPASVPEPCRHIPRDLSVHCFVRQPKAAYRLDLGKGRSGWVHLHDRDRMLGLEARFDSLEIAAAFAKLDAKGPELKLEVVLVPGAAGAVPTATLKSGVRSVALPKTVWEVLPKTYVSDDSAFEPGFERSQLLQEAELLQRAVVDLDAYLRLATRVAVRTRDIGGIALQLVAQSNDLLNRYQVAGANPEFAKVLGLCLGELHPRLRGLRDPELGRAFEVVASNSLAHALRLHDDAMAARVLDSLLGPGFDIGKIESGTLLYNLACFHNFRHQRQAMLQAVRLAVDRGKTADQFLDDPDFAALKVDGDFLAALGAIPPKKGLREKFEKIW